MYRLQASGLESFLRKTLKREDIRVVLRAKPEAFPEIKDHPRTSDERWEYLRRINPLIEELRLQAQGQVLPQEVKIPFPDEEKSSTKEKS